MEQGYMLEHYRLLRTLSGAQMGETVLVEDVQDNDTKVLTFLPNCFHTEKILETFRREGKALLQAPKIDNVTSFCGYGTWKERLFYVRTYVNGGTLDRYIHRSENLSEESIMALWIKIVALVRNLEEQSFYSRYSVCALRPEKFYIGEGNQPFFVPSFFQQTIDSAMEDELITYSNLELYRRTLFASPNFLRRLPVEFSDYMYHLGLLLAFMLRKKELNYEVTNLAKHCNLILATDEFDLSNYEEFESHSLLTKLLKKNSADRPTKWEELENV